MLMATGNPGSPTPNSLIESPKLLAIEVSGCHLIPVTLTSPGLGGLGTRLEATPAQIALAWLLDVAKNILLIPGTRTRTHLAENIDAAGVRLDDAARAELARFPDARS
jgi:diketogulonate reductase-like aldo/keto reductase